MRASKEKYLYGLWRIIKDLPDFKKIHEFVTYVHKYNTKDDEEDEATLNNLVDPNYADLKVIKEDNALRKFNELRKYGKVKIADLYKSARDLGYLEKRDSSNSTHVQGTAIIVPERGKEFIHVSKRLKMRTGKWHAMVMYFAPWSLIISIVAIVVSVISIIVVLNNE